MKKRETFVLDHPSLTEVLYDFFKVTKRPMKLDEIMNFFFNFSKNQNAPKSVKELKFKIIDGEPFSDDLKDYLDFCQSLQDYPYV